MNAVSKKMTAIILVAVIAVAGLGAWMMLGDGGGSETELDASLPVYGNADEDYKIDKNDLDIVKKVVNGESGYDIDTYPLSDADYNGKVDDADIALLNKILDKENCTVHHGMNDGNDGWMIVDTKWPIKKAATSANLQLLMIEKMAGIIDDHIVAVAFSPEYGIDPYLYPTLQGMSSLGPSQSSFDVDLVSQCKSDKRITALFASSNLKNLPEIEKMGVDVIRMDQMSADVSRFVSQILLMGFLFDETNQAVEIGAWSEDLLDEINGKLATLKDNELVSAGMNVGQTGTLSYKGSEYVKVLLQAGAVYPDELDTSSTPAIGDWIYSMDMDKIVCMRNSTDGYSWYGGNPDFQRYFEAVYNTLKLTDAYQAGEVYAIGLDMPLPIRIAYLSQALYPELHGEGWADSKHQEFIDKFFDGTFDVDSIDFLLEYKDYKDRLDFE